MHLQEKFGIIWNIEEQTFVLEVNGELISTYQFIDPTFSKDDGTVKIIKGKIKINGKWIIGNE